jgi:hypothetical protein
MALPGWTRSDWFKNTAIIVATALIAYLMVCAEVIHRAKREFNEGEKYYGWYQNAQVKATDLAALKNSKKMSENEYEHLMEEDMYKEAVVWWQTVGDFYYLPHSRWVDQAEDRIWTTGQEHEARGWKQGLKKGRDDLEHALMSYKAIADSFKPLHGRTAGKHLDEAARKIADLEAKGLRWP